MPRPASTDGLDKFQRYRTTQRSRGMKLFRVWVPDPRAPGFKRKRIGRHCCSAAPPRKAEALDFIEAAADQEP